MEEINPNSRIIIAIENYCENDVTKYLKEINIFNNNKWQNVSKK